MDSAGPGGGNVYMLGQQSCLSTSVQLVTGRRTSPRLPRSPGAAAEELEAVLAHDALDAADVWAQALPQPGPLRPYAFSFTLHVDSLSQIRANLMERATQEWDSIPLENYASVIAILLSLLGLDYTPVTTDDEEEMSHVEWSAPRVSRGVMELRSTDDGMRIIFRFRVGRNWAHVVAREGRTVQFVDIEYEGHVAFMRTYASDDDGYYDDTSDDDSSDDDTSDDDGSEDDRHTGQRNEWASSDEHDADPASDTASDDEWRVDPDLPSMEEVFETRPGDWPAIYADTPAESPARFVDYWPAEPALSLVQASMHWDTYDSAQRRQVLYALLVGFDRLLPQRRSFDENAWDIVRWRPLLVDEGRFEANSVCGRHIVFFLFDTERELQQTRVLRVRILYYGPVEFVRAN
jgi:hypothetical protein